MRKRYEEMETTRSGDGKAMNSSSLNRTYCRIEIVTFLQRSQIL